MGEMNYEIRYLPFAGMDDDGNPKPAREMRHKLKLDDHTPTGDEIDSLWEKQTEGTIDAESHDGALSALWNQWNAGSGRESVAFARRECKDCEKVFTGEQDDGTVDLARRQKASENHERKTRANGDPHEVGHGYRSLSVGDIVVLNGTAYLCASFGWEEIGVFSDYAHAGTPVGDS